MTHLLGEIYARTIKINFKENIIWDEISVPIHTKDTFKHGDYCSHDSEIIAEATARTTKILGTRTFNQKIATCQNVDYQQKQHLKTL